MSQTEPGRNKRKDRIKGGKSETWGSEAWKGRSGVEGKMGISLKNRERPNSTVHSYNLLFRQKLLKLLIAQMSHECCRIHHC